MGRKPNPLILEYFVRGPKLNDNSNRYPHTCKQCGENFPKGRIDSLTTHITKKCPAISEPDRMRACLELHGITNARTLPDRNLLQANGHQENGQSAHLPELPQGWSALETLAEASRQVDLNENNRGQKSPDATSAANPPAVASTTTMNNEFCTERFEVQEQFTLDNPPVSYDARAQSIKRTDLATPPPTELSPEERLQALLPGGSISPDAANISVAVAATARLNPSFLDPQLVNGDPVPVASPPVTEDIQPQEVLPLATPEPNAAQPWGEMTYLASTPTAPIMNEIPIAPHPLNRGGVRMDTSDGSLNGKPRHARARFTPARRKEVQEVRKIGACIRCRILRKNCGRGTPCDTCRKVLAPRVWRTGCVRTRLHEQLDLYSAGVQVVLSQNRINLLKEQLHPINNGTVIDMSHYPETEIHISAPTLVALLEPSESQAEIRGNKDAYHQVIMIDQDAEDLPDKVERYMRAVLNIFIEREPSKFMRVTLETAQQLLSDENDDLLKKALELWGLVETIDRERQWTILEKPGAEGEQPRWIKESQSGNDADIYTMICMQLNAAAERRANNTSKSLLSLMHRLLQDSKIKIGFKMFLTALIFLNCVEKSTWAFKAWEQDHLRPGWPLERDPSAFTQQGGNLAGLLKMLLAIRKALPQTIRNEEGKLATKDQDPVVSAYFEKLDLDYDTIAARQKDSQFSPADSRSLELTFCSHLLLPNVPV
ncbi:unnamed protein product [Clonostachys byssicola]|uniref:Uncharacterized protein n=1 Tax=Clonostachys byssicola TaxID=160290 RepID=A0A9N9U5W3_9HYPO|nr:unnamed protein product [Clonostachys byssicola]